MLDNIDKKNPFKVPDDYFQNLSSVIVSQLPEKQMTKKTKKVYLKSKFKWVAVAAAIVGMAFLGVDYLSQNTPQPVVQQQHTNSQEQLSALQNDYYLFIEDEANQSLYYDILLSDKL